MARVAVLNHNQNENDRARVFVKRSIGKLLVRRGLAEWMRKNAVLRMLPPREPIHQPATSTFFVPEKLPPIELPGLRFEDPRQPFRPPIDIQVAAIS